MRRRYYASYGCVYDRHLSHQKVFDGTNRYNSPIEGKFQRYKEEPRIKIYNDFRDAVKKAEELNQ